VPLKDVTAGVVNIIRSFLSLFTRRRRKRASRSGTAVNAAAATDSRGTAADEAGARLDKAITEGDAASVIGAAGSSEVTATAADVAAIAANAAVAAANMAAITSDATSIAADAAAATAVRAAGPASPAKPQGRQVMSSGFDMQTEIAKLAERIIEPIATKLNAQEREQIVGQIRDAFEKLNLNAPDARFEDIAVSILERIDPKLTDAERKRGVDRISGAMAAFCQSLGQRAA
jgi:hypothetical protein